MSEHENTASLQPAPAGRGDPFIVQCEGFRCMAYRDKTGKWRDYFNGDEISGEVQILTAA